MLLLRVQGKVVGHLTLDHHRGTRWRAMVLLAPTETFAGPQDLAVGTATYGTAPAGPWTRTFRSQSGEVGAIQARIQRDTSYGQGNTGARQSYFLDPLDEPYAPEGDLARVDQPNAALRRQGSLNGMATGAHGLVVGGRVASSGKPAAYSGAGMAEGRAVDFSVTTERAPLAPGMSAAGTLSSTTVAASGTSSASPQAARLLALSLIASPLPAGATRADVLARIATLPQSAAVTDPMTQPQLGEFVVQT